VSFSNLLVGKIDTNFQLPEANNLFLYSSYSILLRSLINYTNVLVTEDTVLAGGPFGLPTFLIILSSFLLLPLLISSSLISDNFFFIFF
jgi:hypothetical protein